MKVSNFFSHSKKNSKPPLEGVYIYIFTAILGYAVADLSIMSYRPDMLPKEAPPLKPQRITHKALQPKSHYNSIMQRNIFDHDGKVPPALGTGGLRGEEEDSSAVPSQLPLKLMGTIVHINPVKSVATILMSNKNKTGSFKAQEIIEHMAKLLDVQRRKVIFRNLNNQRKEYIEIPEDKQVLLGVKSKSSAPKKEIDQRGDFEFSVKRDVVDKYTNDLSSILRQARMVPNIIPGSGGKVEGFRFVTIKPGSIFETLGLKVGDVIKGVDGETINSPTKAMELYNALKTSNNIQLDVDRNGRKETFRYNIE